MYKYGPARGFHLLEGRIFLSTSPVWGEGSGFLTDLYLNLNLLHKETQLKIKSQSEQTETQWLILHIKMTPTPQLEQVARPTVTLTFRGDTAAEVSS